MRPVRRLLPAAALLLLLLAVPQVAEACPVCFGAIDGPEARGVNNGILTMLGIVFTVQFGFGALFIGMWRRGKRLAESEETLKVINGGRG